MNTMPSPTSVASTGNYQATRFNALQHGVLSRYAVLPWEDRSEYQALLDALVAEHAPQGPTEEHLVEELAGIIWRKRRLRMAEAAMFREELRRDVTGYTTPEHLAVAALLPLTGTTNCKANIPQALTTNTRDTARDLRDVKRDQAMTRKAWEILAEDGPNAYTHALASLREDTRTCWLKCLDDPPSDGCEYVPAAESLKAWIDRRWDEWFEEPIAELEHREAIREQAFGSAYGTNRLETSVRYEVHLDRKLERTLTMLIRLRDLRCTTTEPA
jgi:hypothetical protein